MLKSYTFKKLHFPDKAYSLFKIVLGQNFFNCEPISKIFAAQFRTNQTPNSAKKIICIQLNEMEDISKKPLSESRNYTLVLSYRYSFSISMNNGCWRSFHKAIDKFSLVTFPGE